MGQLAYYDLNTLESNEVNKKAVSFNTNGEDISFFSDNIWDFTKSDFFQEYRKSKYKINFNFRLDNGLLFNEYKYTNLVDSMKYFVFVMLQKNSYSTGQTYYSRCKKVINYLVLNNILSFKDINLDVILGFRQYLIEKYPDNPSAIYGGMLAIKAIVDNRRFISNCFKDNILENKDFIFLSNRKEKEKKQKQTNVIPDHYLKDIISQCNKTIDNLDFVLKMKTSYENFKIQADKENKTSLTARTRWYKSQSIYTSTKNLYSDMEEIFTASMVLVSIYTGMRCGELLHIPVDCIKKENTKCENTNYAVYYLKSTTFKYEEDATGTKDTNDMRSEWLANGEVVKAVETLHKLYKTEHSSINNNGFLFCSVHGKNIGQLKNQNLSEKIKKYLNDDKIHHHQFRRTFARLVARSAFCDVDILKEHFKHKTREITEYYMKGDVDNEFLEMISEEQDKIKNSLLWDQLIEKAKNEFSIDYSKKLTGKQND
jgi:hypothetical protein